MAKTKRFVLGVSGASGAVYALGLAEKILSSGAELFCSISDSAKIVMKAELGNDDISALMLSRGFVSDGQLANFKLYDNLDFYAPQASGSFFFDAAIVAPCSMKSLGKLANGIADNLFLRAAEVALKERRRLLIMPRETPLAPTHLRNMAYLSECGAIIMPPSPAFYHVKNPTAQDLVDFVVARALSAIGIEQKILPQWGLATDEK